MSQSNPTDLANERVLKVGNHTLTFDDREGFAIPDQDFTIDADGQKLTLPDAVGRPTRLTGTVIDKDTDAPIANADVTLEGGGITLTTTTDANGRFGDNDELTAIKAGDYVLTVTKTGYSEETQNITLTNGEQLDVTVKLSPTTLAGTVVDFDTGDPVADVTVALDTGETTTTDADGNYEFLLPPTGLHTLTFTKDRYGDRNDPGNDVQEDFNIKAGKDNVVPDVRIAQTKITGKVEDDANNPLQAQVQLDSEPPVETEPNGRFEFGLVLPGIHDVKVSEPGFITQTIPVALLKGEEKNLGTVKLQPAP
jgi:5-hydroxyisourate hydrolase-like protein (transthyretin family)